MKQPEHMDAGEMTADRYDPTDEEVRRSVRHWLDQQADFDASGFFEAYIDPEGPFRWTGDFDARDALDVLLRDDPHMVAEALREYVRDNP